MLNVRTVILSVALVFVLTLTICFGTTRTEVVSDPESAAASVLDNQEQPASQNKVTNTRSYRYRLGENFDIPLMELASDRNASRVPVLSYRSRLDENFDVPLRELASDRNANPATILSYRSRLDENFDVPLMERAGYRKRAQRSPYRTVLPSTSASTYP